MLNDQRRKDCLCFALLLLGALGVRLWFFHGIYPSDQAVYSTLAYNLLGGRWLGNSFYEASTRWGFLLPTALFYRLFGVNEASSTLWSMTLSLGTIVVGYKLGYYLNGRRAGWLAAVLIATFPLEVAYASQLMGDVPLSFWLLLSLYWFVRGDGSDVPQPRRRYFFACGLALGMAYATKFVAVLICPLFLLLIVIRRRIDWHQTWIAMGFAMVLIAELVMFARYAGNGLLRLESILADRADTAQLSSGQAIAWKFDVLSTSVWHYLYWMFVDLHHVGGAFLLLGILGGVALFFPRLLETQARFTSSYWLVVLWASTFLVMLSCYPTSTKPYVPLYKMPNYMMMFSAPLLVATAVLLAWMPRWFQHLSVGAVGVSALLCVILSCENHRERVDNVRALYAFSTTHADRPLYGLKRDLDLFPFFTHFVPASEYKVLSSEKYGTQAKSADDLSSLHGAYVAVDHHFLIYDKDRYDLPAQITQPPSSWRIVFTYQRQPHWLKGLVLGIVDIFHHSGLLTSDVREAVGAKLQGWSHTDPLVIYAVD